MIVNQAKGLEVSARTTRGSAILLEVVGTMQGVPQRSAEDEARDQGTSTISFVSFLFCEVCFRGGGGGAAKDTALQRFWQKLVTFLVFWSLIPRGFFFWHIRGVVRFFVCPIFFLCSKRKIKHDGRDDFATAKYDQWLQQSMTNERSVGVVLTFPSRCTSLRAVCPCCTRGVLFLDGILLAFTFFRGLNKVRLPR